ncbi:MAG: CAP domain-containing protein [Defluviitaleaceae bacterium]|nr:CAP domain-containing protein [Defluviitaleaceae bacterium]
MLACMLSIFIMLFLPCMVSAYSYQGPETELVALINTERAKNGAPALVVNWEVARLARYKSEEMKRHGMLSHESLVYGSPAQQLTRFMVPHSMVGSNIAMGHETSQQVLEAWISSHDHHTNLLNAKYTSAGVGLSIDDDGIYYWTLLLVNE